MKGINASRAMIIVLLIIIVIFAVIIIKVNCPISNQPLQSHLLQNPADHVVLSREYHVGGCGIQESDFFRIYPDGTKDDTPFRVPDRRLLVVTDVDWWLADFHEPNAPGYATYFTLALEHKVGNLITTFRVFKDTLLNDPQDRLGRSVGMTAGFVVAPDTRICPFAQVAPSNDQDRLRINAILRGYLIDGESGTAHNE
jgi:hypothetical protein